MVTFLNVNVTGGHNWGVCNHIVEMSALANYEARIKTLESEIEKLKFERNEKENARQKIVEMSAEVTDSNPYRHV